MKIYYINNLNEIHNDREICIALGYFDGIHLGHLELIKKCLEVSKENNLTSSLLTFDPAPNSILCKESYIGNINSLDDKFKIIQNYGIERIYVVKFSLELSHLSNEDFIDKILKPLNVKHVVCGFDFTFGYKGKGKALDLKNHFDLSVVNEFCYKNEKVSTSRIKKCLLNGDIKTANILLGYNYIIQGNVVHGLKNGRKIGYPTANINHNGYVLPKKGVYACYTYVDGKKYSSMVNVGNHPTISELTEPIIESYIFNFDQEIYDKNIKIEFIDYIREEKDFNNVENLKNRLNLDTKLIAKIL